MTSTQQSEAQQAIRLLYKGATEYNVGPEALYQARVLLEGFIKSAWVLESTEGVIPGIEFVGGIRYATNETVRFSKWHDETAKIVCILAHHNLVLIRLSTGTITPLYYGELMALNPEGSK